MKARTAPNSTRQPAADDALARLLTAESNLAAQVAAAREEAEEILRVARDDAARFAAACDATIDAGRARLTSQHEQRLAAELADIKRDAERTTAKFESVHGALFEEYVALVIERLLAAQSAQRSG